MSVHESGLLLKDNLFVLPDSLVEKAISISLVGYLGIDKCVSILKSRYFFDKMHAKVTSFIKRCRLCMSNAPQKVTRPQPMMITDVVEKNSKRRVNIICLF